MAAGEFGCGLIRHGFGLTATLNVGETLLSLQLNRKLVFDTADVKVILPESLVDASDVVVHYVPSIFLI